MKCGGLEVGGGDGKTGGDGCPPGGDIPAECNEGADTSGGGGGLAVVGGVAIETAGDKDGGDLHPRDPGDRTVKLSVSALWVSSILIHSRNQIFRLSFVMTAVGLCYLERTMGYTTLFLILITTPHTTAFLN